MKLIINRNKKILILCSIVIILLILCSIFNLIQSRNFNTEETYLKSAEKILKEIKNKKENETIIIDTFGDKKVKSGKLIKLADGTTYGVLNYKDKCITKYSLKEELVISDKCDKNLSIVPDTASKVIQESASNKEFINDTKETGLNSELEFSSKKYFVGKNPDNYIIYSKSCWRVINIAQNNTIKIIYEAPTNDKGTCEGVADVNTGSLALLTWDDDTTRKGTWEEASSLRVLFEEWSKYGYVDFVDRKIEFDTSILADADWYIGMISPKNKTFKQDLEQERSVTTSKSFKLGLINATDYLKINCSTDSSSTSPSSCGNNNYLYKASVGTWIINSSNENKKVGWLVGNNGMMKTVVMKHSWEWSYSGTRPVAYLKSDVKLFGNGSEKNPYQITK